MRGGTHFGEAGEALFGPFSSSTTTSVIQSNVNDVTPNIFRGTYRGWSSVFNGFVVDGDDDTISIFTTEAAARAWASGE